MVDLGGRGAPTIPGALPSAFGVMLALGSLRHQEPFHTGDFGISRKLTRESGWLAVGPSPVSQAHQLENPIGVAGV